MALINSDQPLTSNEEIGERGFSRFQLTRNKFELSDVKGTLRKLDILCDNKKNSFSFAEKNTWNIPASWGQCSIYVHGDLKTSFNIIELADKTS